MHRQHYQGPQPTHSGSPIQLRPGHPILGQATLLGVTVSGPISFCSSPDTQAGPLALVHCLLLLGLSMNCVTRLWLCPLCSAPRGLCPLGEGTARHPRIPAAIPPGVALLVLLPDKPPQVCGKAAHICTEAASLGTL